MQFLTGTGNIFEYAMIHADAQNLQPFIQNKSICLPLKAERAGNMEEKRRVSAQVIGANIRRIRLEHGETQQQLGELLGYGATTIANYERGYRLPDLETYSFTPPASTFFV